MVTENPDHNRITSMSCLKKVTDTVETECGQSFTNVVLWSGSMGTQFRSWFIFQLLVGTMFLNKSLCWFYNERHHGKVPIDDVGGSMKNVIFRKVKSGQIVVHTLNDFLMLPWNLRHLLLQYICLMVWWNSWPWKHPSGTIHPRSTFNPQIC